MTPCLLTRIAVQASVFKKVIVSKKRSLSGILGLTIVTSGYLNQDHASCSWLVRLAGAGVLAAYEADTIQTDITAVTAKTMSSSPPNSVANRISEARPNALKVLSLSVASSIHKWKSDKTTERIAHINAHSDESRERNQVGMWTQSGKM